MKKEEILPNAVYSTEEAAELLGLNVLTVQKYIREKKLEAVVIGGKWYKVTGESLLHFIDESKTYQIIPCSWKLKEEDKWVPRVDIVENLIFEVRVRNWVWEKERFDSKETADTFARANARLKLMDEHQEIKTVIDEALGEDETSKVFKSGSKRPVKENSKGEFIEIPEKETAIGKDIREKIKKIDQEET